jgi:hypothetical protein
MDRELIDLSERIFSDYVDNLFEKNRTNSVYRLGDLFAHDPTWGLYYPVDDEGIVAILKERTRRALAARAWFTVTGPAWAQPLPISRTDIDNVRCECDGGREELLGHFVSSLINTNWDYRTHPVFFDFACGVMASAHAPEHLREDPELLQEFPPVPLVGLSKDLGWYSPEMLAEEARLQELMWGSSAAADTGHEVKEV